MHYVDEGEGAPVLMLHGQPMGVSVPGSRSRLHIRSRVSWPPTTSASAASTSRRRSRTTPYDFHSDRIERLVDELNLVDTTLVVSRLGWPHRAAPRRRTAGSCGPARRPEHRDRRGHRRRRSGFATATFASPGIDSNPVGSWKIRARAVEDEVVRAYNAPFPVPESKAASSHSRSSCRPTSTSTTRLPGPGRTSAARSKASKSRRSSSPTPIRCCRPLFRSDGVTIPGAGPA